jgi:hypothetical protein
LAELDALVLDRLVLEVHAVFIFFPNLSPQQLKVKFLSNLLQMIFRQIKVKIALKNPQKFEQKPAPNFPSSKASARMPEKNSYGVS